MQIPPLRCGMTTRRPRPLARVYDARLKPQIPPCARNDKSEESAPDELLEMLGIAGSLDLDSGEGFADLLEVGEGEGQAGGSEVSRSGLEFGAGVD